jgi:asparagine synthase (glutamine-hydrolysing)
LAILDLSPAGEQPMTDITSKCTITFNGEIYNHLDIRAYLIQRGYGFQSGTDTEVILKAYVALGVSCLQRFVGMFSFALYDGIKNQILIARDRVGEKPLFYYHTAAGIAVGSEIKALLEIASGQQKIELNALDEYLTWGYVGADRCLLDGYRKLPPGCYGIYDIPTARLSIERYWTAPMRTAKCNKASTNELSDELDGLLHTAVRDQLLSDVPLGLFLSGGLDSSIVTAMASKLSTKVRTFTVTFPNATRLDESNYARRIASHFGTEHTEIPMGDIDTSFLDDLAVQVDEPIGDTSILPTAALSRATRSHVTVALGGDGADELFGGYPQYNRLASIDAWRRRLPAPLRKTLAEFTASYSLTMPGHNTVCSLFDEPGSIGKFNIYFNKTVRNLLLPAGTNVQSSIDTERARDRLATHGLAAGERASRADLASYLPDEVLVKVDRASMLFSLEARAPFLDHRVIEFAMGKVPWKLKVDGGANKILLRHLANRLFPIDHDVNRKQGFTPPIAPWLHATLAHDVASMITHLGLIGFDLPTLRLLAKNPVRNGNRLFLLLMLSKWMLHYRISL